MQLTVKDIAQKFRVTPMAAQGLVTFLAAAGKMRKVGVTPREEGAKGKGANIWEVENTVTINFKD